MNFLLDEYRKELLNIDQNSPYKREIFNTLKNEIKNNNLWDIVDFERFKLLPISEIDFLSWLNKISIK